MPRQGTCSCICMGVESVCVVGGAPVGSSRGWRGTWLGVAETEGGVRHGGTCLSLWANREARMLSGALGLETRIDSDKLRYAFTMPRLTASVRRLQSQRMLDADTGLADELSRVLGIQ